MPTSTPTRGRRSSGYRLAVDLRLGLRRPAPGRHTERHLAARDATRRAFLVAAVTTGAASVNEVRVAQSLGRWPR